MRPRPLVAWMSMPHLLRRRALGAWASVRYTIAMSGSLVQIASLSVWDESSACRCLSTSSSVRHSESMTWMTLNILCDVFLGVILRDLAFSFPMLIYNTPSSWFTSIPHIDWMQTSSDPPHRDRSLRWPYRQHIEITQLAVPFPRNLRSLRMSKCVVNIILTVDPKQISMESSPM